MVLLGLLIFINHTTARRMEQEKPFNARDLLKPGKVYEIKKGAEAPFLISLIV